MRIVQELNSRGTLGVEELTELVSASPATVRRDLTWLDEQGLISRTRGGAMALRHGQVVLRNYDSAFEQRLGEHVEEKRLIGRAAAAMVNNGETIILDAGTSALAMVPFLAEKRDVTVITNSLVVMNELVPLMHANPSLAMLVTGGTMRTRSMSFVGLLADQMLSQVFADKVFLGVRGMSSAHGMTDAVLEEIAIKRRMIQAARQVIALADHSKFTLTYTCQIAPFSAAHIIITDDKIDPELARQVAAHGPQVVVAK